MEEVFEFEFTPEELEAEIKSHLSKLESDPRYAREFEEAAFVYGSLKRLRLSIVQIEERGDTGGVDYLYEIAGTGQRFELELTQVAAPHLCGASGNESTVVKRLQKQIDSHDTLRGAYVVVAVNPDINIRQSGDKAHDFLMQCVEEAVVKGSYVQRQEPDGLVEFKCFPRRFPDGKTRVEARGWLKKYDAPLVNDLVHEAYKKKHEKNIGHSGSPLFLMIYLNSDLANNSYEELVAIRSAVELSPLPNCPFSGIYFNYFGDWERVGPNLLYGQSIPAYFADCAN